MDEKIRISPQLEITVSCMTLRWLKESRRYCSTQHRPGGCDILLVFIGNDRPTHLFVCTRVGLLTTRLTQKLPLSTISRISEGSVSHIAINDVKTCGNNYAVENAFENHGME